MDIIRNQYNTVLGRFKSIAHAGGKQCIVSTLQFKAIGLK